MSGSNVPEPPAQLKAIASYMKVASDIERIDPVVAYWVRLYSTETALSIDRESPECKTFLSSVIIYLEQFKQNHKDNEAVTNQTVGQAHTENFVVNLFNKVDTLDREGTANKTTVRMFYMAAVLFEAMAVFGSLTDEIAKRAKYAKFKAAYIQKCLKAGQTPKPGPIEGSDLEVKPDEEQLAPNKADGSDNSTTAGQSSSNDQSIVPPEVPKGLGDSDTQEGNKPDPFIMKPSQPPYGKLAPVLPPVMPQPSLPQPHDSRPDVPGQSTISATKFHATNGNPISAEDLIQSQKYCKFANSALQYDDVKTAVENLEKALKLLTTGQKSD